MAATPFLPHLPEDWEPTRATLHAYARAVDAVPRAHGVAHPKWWHVSLKVRPHGLVTDTVPLPGGGTIALGLDLVGHEVFLEVSDGTRAAWSMTNGASGTAMAEDVIAAVAGLGLAGEYNREKFENDEPRTYDPASAATFLAALVNVERQFERHRVALGDRVSPIQVWPHGFDLAFEWYGTRVETYEEHGATDEYPSQLNLGFYPGGRPYFYSNPWPFEQSLVGTPLPHGAEWHTEGWQGTILHYDTLAGDPGAADKLLEFAEAVHAAAAPTLTA